ncbi:MAG: GTPase HflX [bacterium]|nr:GTPase HflX [bacterium]
MDQKERIISVAINLLGKEFIDIDFSLDELRWLIETAGGIVVATFSQKLRKLHARYLIGEGKLKEIKVFVDIHNIDTVVFDDPLTPAQKRNIEQFLNIKVIDRTYLILDIFALHAKTKESKLQIELAQLRYSLPRLVGKGITLSRQSGGIGTRGPGEQKLEIDARRISERISKIRLELKKIVNNRKMNRRMRKKKKIPLIAIVGYTNSGKSTLLKTLTGQNIFIEDKLFATLGTQIKRFELPNSQKILLLDTVGFVQKLPHELISAFRSTLEEIKQADLIIHLMDFSIKHYEDQKRSVYQVLKEIKADKIPIIEVYNKIDLLKNQKLISKDIVAISAREKIGYKKLFFELINALSNNMVNLDLKIPYQDSAIIKRIYEEGIVNTRNYEDALIKINADIKKEFADFLKKYL